MRVLVAGGTGLVGRELVDQLVAAGDEVVLLSRRELGGRPQVEVQVVDFAALDAVEIGECEVAYCALGTTIRVAGSREAFVRVDRDAVLASARLARRAGVHTFVVVTALGADARSSVFYNRVKGEVEQALAELGFAHLIVLRPSILDGDRDESRPGEVLGLVVMRAFAPLMLGPLRRYRPSRAVDVAAACMTAARETVAAMQAAAREPVAAMRIVEAEEIPRLAARRGLDQP